MRLIDAEALKHKRVIAIYGNLEQGLEEREVVYIEDIDNARTIEAKPVVHSHWEKYDDSEFCYCSHCGKPAAEDDDVSWHGYCPVCGAQMDEGVKIPVISMEDVPKIMEEMEK